MNEAPPPDGRRPPDTPSRCEDRTADSGMVRITRVEATKLEPMDIGHFDDLLVAARQQPDAQRLLLVFAAASLPPDAASRAAGAFRRG